MSKHTVGDCLHATLEPNDHNSDGVAITLYFEGGPRSIQPAVEDIQDALDDNLHLCLCSENEAHTHEVSTAAYHHLKPGVVRVQVYPV